MEDFPWAQLSSLLLIGYFLAGILRPPLKLEVLLLQCSKQPLITNQTNVYGFQSLPFDACFVQSLEGFDLFLPISTIANSAYLPWILYYNPVTTQLNFKAGWNFNKSMPTPLPLSFFR